MKKTILVVIALLCLNFGVRAQAIDVTTKGLQIGQEVPNTILSSVINYTNASGKPSTSATLADFKGKLLILDFWATWCAPCVAAIPKLENLQKKFEGKVQILPVTYQPEKIVLSFLADLNQRQRIQNSLPNVVAEKELHKLFPHVYLPHYVWIGENGKVIAITNGKPVNEEEITKVLNRNYQGLLKKQDFNANLDWKAPLFVNGNGGDGSTLVYHSMLSSYVVGIGSGFRITSPNEGNDGFSKMLAKNVAIPRLFNVALGAGKKQYGMTRVVYETKDSLLIDPLRMGDLWKSLSWCYELSLPSALQSRGFELMYEDLARLFPQYSVTLEKRNTLCYALRKIPGMEIIPSTGGSEALNQNSNGLRMRNATLNLFINALDNYYYQDLNIPIVNLVGDQIKTDLVINAPLTNPEAINLELTKYGLELVKGQFEIDMIVYRDAVKK